MNGIYLQLLLREIGKDLEAAVVQSILQRGRILQIVMAERSLYIALYPRGLGMFVVKSSRRGYEPLKMISESVRSCRITAAVQEHCMPVMRLALERQFPRTERPEVIVSFYPQAPNLVLRTESWQRNLFPRFIEKEPKSSILVATEADIAHASVDYIVKNFEGVDKKMASEIKEGNLVLIQSALRGARIRPRLISVDPLHISLCPGVGGEEFPTFNELFSSAIERFYEHEAGRQRDQERRLLERNLERRIARLKKKCLNDAEIESLRTAGELILANSRRITKGLSRVTLVDHVTQQERDIILDPRLSPQGNAQRYFARYKKEKRGQPKLAELIARLQKEMEGPILQKGVRAPTSKKQDKAEPVREPFHRFTLDSGAIVLVGKNARSNDRLTFEHARPDDYFFHARGVEGAHVILRSVAAKGQRPPRDTMTRAAAIAAYFSKARKQRNVPVSYTQRKYLKKSKRSKAGSVTMMREEVIFVDPALPD